MSDGLFQTRSLGAEARLGISCLLLVALGGFVASGRHLVDHHENRDERPGLSMDDVRGAYHGIKTIAPLRTALEGAHPADVTDDPNLHLAASDRTILLDWIASDRISEDFDNLDLGDAAPAEIMAISCLPCHARSASLGDGVGERIPLDYWDDIKKVAFSREMNPVAPEILVASTHAHALSLAALSLVVCMLALATGWPRRLVHFGIGVVGVALMLDLAAWWLARARVEAVWVIVLAGGVYNAAMVLMLLGILVDLWWPLRKKEP